MKHETAAIDGPALSRLLSSNNVTTSLLEQLFGSPEIGEELMGGARLPSLYEATLLGSLMDIDPTVLTGSKKPPLGVSLRLGTADVAQDVRNWVEHATKLLAADRLTATWGFSTPPTEISSFSPSKHVWDAKQSGKKTALRLRAYLDLRPEDPVSDLTEIVEGLGHPVEYANLPENVHGISVPESREGIKHWVVLINCADYRVRQRFTLAHELSHILYQDSGQVIVDRAEPPEVRPEIVADSFARHFLLPDEALTKMFIRHDPVSIPSVQSLISDIMLTYGISRQATVKALREMRPSALEGSLLDVCEGTSVASMMASVGAEDAWSEMEEDRGQPCSSSRLTDQVLNAYADGVASLDTVSDVIAGGDRDKAFRLLRDAGWDMPTALGAGSPA